MENCDKNENTHFQNCCNDFGSIGNLRQICLHNHGLDHKLVQYPNTKSRCYMTNLAIHRLILDLDNFPRRYHQDSLHPGHT